MKFRTLHHLADVALSRGAVPNYRVKRALTSPTPSNRMFSVHIARFDLALIQLTPIRLNSRQFHTPQSRQQSPPLSAPSTSALSKREQRQNQCPIFQTSQDTCVVDVRYILPATGQRTGANPTSTPIATTASTPPLFPHKLEWDHEDRDLLVQSANRPHFTESSNISIRAFVEDAEEFL